MNKFKKYLGLAWLLLGPAFFYFLVAGAAANIDPGGKKDINNPVIWVIIIAIFTPVAIGLILFGWYAWKGDYDHLPGKSADL